MGLEDKAVRIAKILSSKKASDIEVLDIGGLTIVADYFIICTGNTALQVQALANAVMEKMDEEGEHVLRVEGLREGAWTLLDYGSVVVHIFKRDIREFYGLERLWGDAKRLEIPLDE